MSMGGSIIDTGLTKGEDAQREEREDAGEQSHRGIESIMSWLFLRRQKKETL